MSLKESYNSVATEYQTSKTLPFRKCVEEFTIFHILGDVTGRKILDLACGGGHYSRIFKQRGAAKVVGVDVSSSMIQLAEEEEKRNPIGCSYICADAADIDVIDDFDIVTGIYCFMNAETKEKMRIFADNAYKNLRSGGLYVGIDKIDCRHRSEDTTEYGLTIKVNDTLTEGDRLQVSFKNSDNSTFQFEFYYWTEETYEEAFRQAGFKSFQCVGPLLDPTLATQWPPNYWDKFLDVKGLSGFFAIKP